MLYPNSCHGMWTAAATDLGHRLTLKKKRRNDTRATYPPKELPYSPCPSNESHLAIASSLVRLNPIDVPALELESHTDNQTRIRHIYKVDRLILNDPRLFLCRHISCSSSSKLLPWTRIRYPPSTCQITHRSLLWGLYSATFRSPRKRRQGVPSMMTFLGHRRLRATRLSYSKIMFVAWKPSSKMRVRFGWLLLQEANLASIT